MDVEMIASLGLEAADEIADLHGARGATENVADFQVLQHFARDGGGDANDGGDAEDSGHTGSALYADGDHQQCGDY